MPKHTLVRRGFLKSAGLGLAAASLADASSAHTPMPVSRPKLTLSVRDFGATGDGVTKDTAAIQQSIDRCSVLGGGEVLIPAGRYLTGAIALRSHTTFGWKKTPPYSAVPTSPTTPSRKCAGKASGFPAGSA